VIALNEIVKVVNLKKYFEIYDVKSKEKKYVKAVDGISFTINVGETLGLVGESGSGKTTTGKMILNLMKPTSGDIFLEGKSIKNLNKKEMRSLRKDIQVVFQNPYAALDPKMTIRDILIEPLSIHKIVSKYEYNNEVKRLLNMVGLSEKDMNKFPYEFSGGQRQRIGIAKAIAVKPKFIICDEPVSALDVSVQSQILNLLCELQRDLKISYLFIAHGLSVIRHVSDKVAIMYLGNIVEYGDAKSVFDYGAHPYTKALISSAPIPDPKRKNNGIILKGEVPSPINIPEGCPFHPRCKDAIEICKNKKPFLRKIKEDHMAACHLI